MIPPLTLFRLVVAPITAPAAAPIAASRLVFFCTVVCVAGAGVLEPALVPLVELAVDVRRAVVPALLDDRVADRAGTAAAGP